MNEEQLERLVARTRGGDEEAWAALWLALAPLVEGVARRERVTGRLSRCPDAPRDVVIRVMGTLREDGFRRLAELGERLACRDGSFRRWLHTIARNAAIDEVRQHPEFLGRVEEGAPRWAEHTPLSEATPDELPPVSRRIEARRILARSLEMLAPAQRDALHRWLQGEDFAEIAVALHLGGDTEAASRLVRSAVERLRSRFATPKGRGSSRRAVRAKSTGAPHGSAEGNVLYRQGRTTHRQGAGGG